MNLDQYFQRINYEGDRTPTLEVLTQLQQAHLYTIPFENLDIHYNRKITLDIDRIFTKVMNNNRGGFCYELNGLFYELLKELGFQVKRISASVWSDTKQSWPPDFDHLAVIVIIDGQEYLADVGFGDSFFAPLKMVLDEEQQDRKGVYRIRQYDANYFLLEFSEKEDWKHCYIFTKVERAFEDFAARCHWQQTSPEAHFVQNKLITKPTEHGRITLTDKRFKITTGKEKETAIISDEKDFEALLWKYFKIKP